jgi:hypothetical protein
LAVKGQSDPEVRAGQTMSGEAALPARIGLLFRQAGISLDG